jgi:hypothetical protein
MRKLRIVEKLYSDGSVRFEIQRRGLLGSWVNAAHEDACEREFDSLDAAKGKLDYFADPGSWPRKKVVYQNFEDDPQ